MPAKRTRIFLLFLLLAVCFLFLSDSALLPNFTGKARNQKDYKLLGKAISLIKNEYIDEPDPVETMEGAFKSMVDSLDVLSAYLEGPLREKYTRLPEKTFLEPGIILYKTFGSYPQIIGIREESPAAGKELKLGDYISSIDGRSTLPMSMQEVRLLLKEEKAEPVRLEILKPNRTENIIVDRKNLTEDSAAWYPLSKTAGILRIHQLYPPCVERVKDTLREEMVSGSLPLVLDLRNCVEGMYDETVKLVNLYLKEDRIGYFSNRNGPTRYLTCPQDPPYEDIPLIIWTNRATYGPAEMAAAVLQKFKRAKIIGIRTPGLTARQQLFQLEDGSGLLLTTEIFRLPSGDAVWREGVRPEIKLRSADLTTDAYIQQTYKLIKEM